MENRTSQVTTGKRLLPPTYLLTSIAAMVGLRSLLPGVRIITLPWTLLGLLPITFGVYLNLAADRTFKKVGTTVKPFEKSTSLVATGAYAISRHPMYLGFTLILLGIAVLLGVATPFLVVLAFALVMEFRFIRVEQAMMQETFGQDWHTYKARVRRWI